MSLAQADDPGGAVTTAMTSDPRWLHSVLPRIADDGQLYYADDDAVPEPYLKRPRNAVTCDPGLDAKAMQERLGGRRSERQCRRKLAALFALGCPLVRRIARASCKSADRVCRYVIDAPDYPELPDGHTCPAHTGKPKRRQVPVGFVSAESLAEEIAVSTLKHTGTPELIARRVREWCARGKIESERAGGRILIPRQEADAILAGFPHPFAVELILEWAGENAPLPRRVGPRRDGL